MLTNNLTILLLLSVLCFSQAINRHAVLVASSSTYANYRHQSDISHAYQLALASGIPKDNIIVMQYNDIAYNESNPFPGQIFNAPTADGVPGYNVYEGVQIDYAGENVTAAIFLAILTANTNIAHGRVLNSNSESHVFINLVDHGAYGEVEFPDGNPLYVKDLQSAIDTMHGHQMYKELVFYLESCESGSMFEWLTEKYRGVYAVSASRPSQSSWAVYCPPMDFVNGIALNTCLGDVFSVNWMNFQTTNPWKSLNVQFKEVKNATDTSDVCRFGDKSVGKQASGGFESSPNNYYENYKDVIENLNVDLTIDQYFQDLHDAYMRRATLSAFPKQQTIATLEFVKLLNSIDLQKYNEMIAHQRILVKHLFAVNSRDVDLHLAYYKFLRQPTEETKTQLNQAALILDYSQN
jgi:legumain